MAIGINQNVSGNSNDDARVQWPEGQKSMSWPDLLNLEVLGIYNSKAPVRIGDVDREENHVHFVQLLHFVRSYSAQKMSRQDRIDAEPATTKCMQAAHKIRPSFETIDERFRRYTRSLHFAKSHRRNC